MIIAYINTEIGPLSITMIDNAVSRIDFVESVDSEIIPSEMICIADELKDYLKGERKDFTFDLFIEGTTFQKQVWSELVNIPYGETRTYKAIAEAIGNPKAVRAVGGANNKNKIPIVIPCHRVIGADGSLTGYAGGVEIKKELLRIEKK